jgi:ribonuclease Z
MTSLVRILSVQTVDSSPSLLLVSPNGRKTLVNCGEGCQRIFLEFAQKLSSVDRVCLTHLRPDAMAGLPGMILTAADVGVTRHAAATAAAAAGEAKKRRKPATTKPATTAVGVPPNEEGRSDGHQNNPLPGLQLIGPTGTKAFVRSLRHFMRRESFHMDIQEGSYKQDPANKKDDQKKRKMGSTKKQQQQQQDQDAWSIQTIVSLLDDTSGNMDPNHHHSTTTSSDHTTAATDSTLPRRDVLSFLFTTPPVLGRFLADKATELGIPKGPLYGKLKAGQAVTFPDPHDECKVITVESHQVVEPSSPGIVVAVVYYPTLQVLEQLQQSAQLQSFLQQNHATQTAKDAILELMVHMAPRDIFHSQHAMTWRSSFDTNTTKHLFIPTEATCIEEHQLLNGKDNGGGGGVSLPQSLTPFHSASMGTWMRSQISPNIYCRPLLPRNLVPTHNEDSSDPMQLHNYMDAVPLLEYVVIPRKSRGFQNGDAFVKHWKEVRDKAQHILTNSDSLEDAKQLQPLNGRVNGGNSNYAEILFTGTGSAIPCKHRNVSGIHVRMDNGNAMFLDCGEGTIGQLLRASHVGKEEEKSWNAASVLRNVKAVWISHPHADHHLGILRLLEEKKKQRVMYRCKPLIVIAPSCLDRFLMEYEKIDPDIVGSYVFLDCRSLVRSGTTNGHARSTSIPEPSKDLLQRFEQELGIVSCEAIPVAHCRDSFAVVFHGTSFGSLAYSGDCRPSMAFADRARNVDVLIHEATFANGLEADAVLKKHCTVSEALEVGKKMNARTVVLTHFSQRYPTIPPLPATTGDMNIILAFDSQKISPANLKEASQMTPILRKLYPDTGEDDEEYLGESTEAAVHMNIPGLFAQNQLL